MSDSIRAALERLIDALDAPAQVPVGRWTPNVTAARAEARAALTEQQGEGPILQWTDNTPPCEACRYDHCTAETPFGRFLISWKSWKPFDSPTVDETPWGDWYGAFNSVDAAKAACQREMDERLARWGHPAPAPNVTVARAEAHAALTEQQGEGPSEEELLNVAATAIDPYGSCGISVGEYEAETESAVEVYGSELIAFARAVLARWGRPAPALNQVIAGPTTGTDVNAPHFRFLTANDLPTQRVEIERLETPPAEGEVAEVAAWLRAYSDCEFGPHSEDPDHRGLYRAAELLQQQHPTPVPVSEGLLAQNAYIAFVQICKGNSDDAGTYEEDERVVRAALERLHALERPAHALPMPQGEVE